MSASVEPVKNGSKNGLILKFSFAGFDSLLFGLASVCFSDISMSFYLYSGTRLSFPESEHNVTAFTRSGFGNVLCVRVFVTILSSSLISLVQSMSTGSVFLIDSAFVSNSRYNHSQTALNQSTKAFEI